jgi:hypothetical protein
VLAILTSKSGAPYTPKEAESLHLFATDSCLHFLSDAIMNVLFEEASVSVSEQFQLACMVKSVLASVVSSVKKSTTNGECSKVENIWSRIFVFLQRRGDHLIVIREEMVALARLTSAIKLNSELLLKSKISTFANHGADTLWPTSFEEVAAAFPAIFTFDSRLKDNTQPFDPVTQQELMDSLRRKPSTNFIQVEEDKR